MKQLKILAINPGSTSTKIGVFHNSTALFKSNIKHDADELSKYGSVMDQKEFRLELILAELHSNHIDISDIDAFVGRGGGLAPMPGGTYIINEQMLYDTAEETFASHPANLGCHLAHELADSYDKPSYIVNAPTTDEFQELARMTGWKNVFRTSRIHSLNQKEVGIRYADSIGKAYAELKLIICHIGGGISITAHNKGKMVDSSDCLFGEGPMSPTRSGAIPILDVISQIESTSLDTVKKRTITTGGWVDHLKTDDGVEVAKRINTGDPYAKLIHSATAYQIAKSIGSMAAVMKGVVDAIIFTGGLAHDKALMQKILTYVDFIAPVSVIPGEFELEALITGVLRVQSCLEPALVYTGIPVFNGSVMNFVSMEENGVFRQEL